MNFSDKKILIIEDDQVLRDTLVSRLSSHYTVTAAEDGESGLLRIESLRPDAVLLDLLLPKMNGFDVLMRLRDLPDPALAKTPVLVVSNLKDPQSVMRAEQLGVQAYLPKADVDFNTLIVQINKILAERASVPPQAG